MDFVHFFHHVCITHFRSLSAPHLGLGGDTPPKQSASGLETRFPLSGREMRLAPAVHPTRYLGKTKSYGNTEISESGHFHGKTSESEKTRVHFNPPLHCLTHSFLQGAYKRERPQKSPPTERGSCVCGPWRFACFIVQTQDTESTLENRQHQRHEPRAQSQQHIQPSQPTPPNPAERKRNLRRALRKNAFDQAEQREPEDLAPASSA